ncbi:hypothetical protein D9611_000809 [Ephemerocybe angulata]|uniref:Cytochrome P450 n=1 Tax=Ephemerocybe angulata TaxID=980116 RepID=A0A8H5F749_9AGAR|nr:hypothetical protein D9611_000809 [Tulosesus angulatus]
MLYHSASMTSRAQALLLDVAIAVASHYLWFKPYEPTSYSTIFAAVLLLTSPVIYLLRRSLTSTLQSVVLAESVYISALLASIVGYRLSPWHPLASCPGPLLCKVTKIWAAYIAWTGKAHVYYAQLHTKYGRIVRIGPNDISVTEKELFPHILGAQGMPKGPVWANRRTVTSRDAKDHRNLHAVRDLALHSELRKPWNKAFSKDPMKDYEVVMNKNAAILVEQLQELCEREKEPVVDLAKWLSFYSFDFMGDMVFGQSYNFMRDGDPKGIWDVMQESLVWPSIGQHVPWIAPLSTLFPSLMKPSKTFRNFAAKQAKARAQSEPAQRDTSII